MRRYWRTLKQFWLTALAAELEYRVNFVLAAITSLGEMAAGLYVLSRLFGGSETLGSWRWEDALIVFGCFRFMEGLAATTLQPNLARIVEHVQQGTLDFVLIKPIDTPFWLSFRRFSPWGLPDALFGVGLILYGSIAGGYAAGEIALGAVPLAVGAVILYALWFTMATLCVWFVKLHNITEVLRSLLQAGQYPISAYARAWQIVFTFVIPVVFITTVPAEAIRSGGFTGNVLIAAGLAIALLLFSRWFWRFAMRSYTSASS